MQFSACSTHCLFFATPIRNFRDHRDGAGGTGDAADEIGDLATDFNTSCASVAGRPTSEAARMRTLKAKMSNLRTP